jgi:Periplasmic binding protein
MLSRSRTIAVGVAVSIALIGCTSGDDDEGADPTTTTIGGDPASEGEAVDAGAAPGVTDDTIRVGVTFVDTEALLAVGLDYDLGEHEAVYRALFDDINANGGINGRQIEPVFAPIDPTAPASGDAACVRLTEDEDVFVVIGFFLNEAVMCPLEAHGTAVVGGGQSTQRMGRATAPWLTPLQDDEMPETILREMDARGELDGTVAVYAATLDQPSLENIVLPTLEELGIEPVDVAINDAPRDDALAVQNQTLLIAERFESSGADTVLLVGLSSQDWPLHLSAGSYRPALKFMERTAITAFATNAAVTDTSILDGAVAGGTYGPAQAIFDEDAMQECLAILSAAGIETPTPAEVGDEPSNQPFQAAFQACPDVALLRAWLEAAGEDLGYGALQAAVDERFEVAIPGDPAPRTYGPAPSADGDPAAFIFRWDESSGTLVVEE